MGGGEGSRVHDRYRGRQVISPLAYVAPWVEFGEGCIVHPFAVVGKLPDESRALARAPRRIERLIIGPRTIIGCHSVIFGGVAIGADTLIGEFVHIREGVTIGARCVIGRYVSVSYDTEIADDCRFQDGAVITGKVGPECFFGVGVITSNDRNVDLANYHHPAPQLPVFGRRVMVGSGANILAGVTIGDEALIGAGALVVTDVPPGARVLGQKATIR